MDLRTKLVLTLVSVSLASMLALALLSYGPARDLWRQSALEGLEGLAESKQADIERVAEAWKDRVRLIASRTQLRRIAASFDSTHEATEQPTVVRILRDAQLSVPQFGIREITVYDTHQHPFATTIAMGVDEVRLLDAVDAEAAEAGVQILGLDAITVGDPEVRLAAPLREGTRLVGTLLVRMSARDLVQVSQDFTGLGRTGETMIAQPDGTGDIQLLSRPRHGPGISGTLDGANARDPLVRAVQGVDSTFYRNAIDYRGETVWAASRYLPELGIGLVVKFDASEREAPLQGLRRTVTRLAISLSALGILAGIILGLRFAGPIQQLVEVAEKIEAGNYLVRAPVRREDEIGKLAFSFNRMTDRLLETNRRLRARIEEQDRVAEAAASGSPPSAADHGGTAPPSSSSADA